MNPQLHRQDPTTDWEALVADYSRDGFVVVPGLFRDEQIERWAGRLRDLAEGRVPTPASMLVVRDVMVATGVVAAESPAHEIAKLQDFEDDAVLWSYATDPGLLDWIERFVGPEIFSVNTMLINKPPGVDGRHPLHQDLLYFPFRPADKIVGTWTALDRVNKENGCLVAVPGSHRGELLAHEVPDWEHLNAAYYGVPDVGEETPRAHLEMEPGDTVLFHPLLIHGSGRNRSHGFRRAISAHYGSAACTWEWSDRLTEKRPYTVVRGQGAGEPWQGERVGDTDPFQFFPRDDDFFKRRAS